MKHAILILAHTDPQHLLRICQHFQDPDIGLFINWDPRSKYEKPELGFHNIIWYGSTQKPSWGSWEMVLAELYLIQKALDWGASYMHLMSGQDELVRSIPEFKAFFSAWSGYSFLGHWNGEDQSFLGYGGTSHDMVGIYHRLKDVGSNVHGRPKTEAARKYVKDVEEQYLSSIRRPLPPWPRYQGDQWWSLTREAGEEALKWRDKMEPFESDTLIPDERYFQTVLFNSDLRRKVREISLRYINWTDRVDRDNQPPGYCTEKDYQTIKNGPYFFARKFSRERSGRIMDKIDSTWFNPDKPYIPSSSAILYYTEEKDGVTKSIPGYSTFTLAYGWLEPKVDGPCFRSAKNEIQEYKVRGNHLRCLLRFWEFHREYSDFWLVLGDPGTRFLKVGKFITRDKCGFLGWFLGILGDRKNCAIHFTREALDVIYRNLDDLKLSTRLPLKIEENGSTGRVSAR